MIKQPMKILIVDDEPDIVQFLSYNLARENYRVIKAYNGRQAITSASVSLPDLIIMDIWMPEISGLEACRIIRQQKKLLHIPVLFLTADSNEYIAISAIASGGNHYVTKPVPIPFLLSMVREITHS
jgi:two-component system, OmpR family, alkaline phosphatase synthesis response regulator PhoP